MDTDGIQDSRPVAPAPLSYSTPKVYFDAKRIYHRWDCLAGTIVIYAMAGFFFYFFTWGPWFSPQIPLPIRSFGAILTVIALAKAVQNTRGYVSGQIDTIQVTDDGVIANRDLLHWRDIQLVQGWILHKRVRLEFHRSRGLSWALETTPPLTREQYESLARTIQSEVVPQYPHLKVDPTVQEDNVGW